MVSCCIRGCSTRSGKGNTLGLYRVPKVIRHNCNRTLQLTELRRALWAKRIHRKELLSLPSLPDNRARVYSVCSRHFLKGKPAQLFDDTNVDWAPSLHLGPGDDAIPKKVLQHELRYNRAQKRRQIINQTAPVLPPPAPKKNKTTKKLPPSNQLDIESMCRGLQSKLTAVESVELPSFQLEGENEFVQVNVDFPIKQEMFDEGEEFVDFSVKPEEEIMDFHEEGQFGDFPVKEEGFEETEGYFGGQFESVTKEVACQTSIAGDYIDQLERERDELRKELEAYKSGTVVIRRW